MRYGGAVRRTHGTVTVKHATELDNRRPAPRGLPQARSAPEPASPCRWPRIRS